MSLRRGFLGGVCLIVGAIPLILFYGSRPLGYLGVVLAAVGLLVSFGAYRAGALS